MSDDDNDSPTNPSLAASRSRREKKPEKGGRFAALKKLKENREKGHRGLSYEVDEVENVYDVVDEADYADEVRKRRNDDWIVDDDGGYCEDGREIFDDDIDDPGLQEAVKGKKPGKKEEKAKAKPGKSSNIKNMLMSMPSKKKKEEEINIDEDELLGDILGQIKTTPSIAAAKKRAAVASPIGSGAEKAERNPFVKKGTGLKKASVPVTKAGSESKQEDFAASQQIDEFESCPMDGFEDDMDIGDFDEPEAAPPTPLNEAPKVEMKVDPEAKTRGFQASTLVTGSASSSGWLGGELSKQQEPTADLSIDSSKLPVVQVDITDPATGEVSKQDVLRMYWLDAHEDPYKHPGTVWLFGKVWVEEAAAHVSCCLTVKNIPRRVYLAKRELWTNVKTGETPDNKPVDVMDMYTEFNEKVAKRYRIMEHKCRPVQKSYAFEHTDIPDHGEFLEVVYSAQYPALPSDLVGETFGRVFGAPQTSLECFLLEQKLKGPGWLDIRGAVPGFPPTSWCKLEAVASDPSAVNPSSNQDEPPPLTILSLKLATVLNGKTMQNEVAMVGCLAHTGFNLDKPPKEAYNQHYCLVTRPQDEAWPFDWSKVAVGHQENGVTKIEKASSERELLSLLLIKIQKLDPDVVIGHDISGFDLEVLVHRMIQNKIAHWSRLGRLRRSHNPGAGSKYVEKQAMVGRLVCDLKISAKELIRCKSYELGPLAAKCLGEGEEDTRPSVTPDGLRKAYASSEELKQQITMCMRDADQTLRLVLQLNALPLALQITQIVGTVMSKTLKGGRAERIEYLLLHAFDSLGYVVPDKQYGKKKVVEGEEEEGGRSKGKKGKPTYAGGLVLEPKKGFYDKFILLLDFNSLYPSIIQEYNICFTTVNRKSKVGDGDVLPDLPDASLAAGVLPTQIKKLIDARREVKKMLKNDANLTEAKKAQLNIRQLALKLTANSMYGCLGFSFSRFFAKPLAALVTSKGREILLQTRDLVQKMNLEVIYGDTDSIMVNSNSTDYEEVFKLGREIKTNVNKLYKLLELDIDGVYKYMLLLKKKKYAAVTIERGRDGKLKENTELKGLDIVRRDWSGFASEAGLKVIEIIMTDKTQDTRLSEIQEHLEGLRVSLADGKIPLRDLAITKSLTKDPADYPDKKALPHVQVALRINSAGGKKLRAGDTVEYVICEDGSGLAATQRAYHVDEVRDSATLNVDKHYYLAQQLHPVVSRLCDPIDGMDGARIAGCLGLDPGQYKSRPAHNDDEEGAGQLRDEDRFRACERLIVPCVCGASLTVDSPIRGSGRDAAPSLLVCPATPSCGSCPLVPGNMGKLMNTITLLMRKQIQKYYAGWLVCEDPGCAGRTRQIPLKFQRAFPVCPTCSKATMYSEYSDSQLYNQLMFYLHLVDMERALSKGGEGDEMMYVRNKLCGVGEAARNYKQLKEKLGDKFLKNNGYSVVSLNKIFEGLFPGQ